MRETKFELRVGCPDSPQRDKKTYKYSTRKENLREKGHCLNDNRRHAIKPRSIHSLPYLQPRSVLGALRIYWSTEELFSIRSVGKNKKHTHDWDSQGFSHLLDLDFHFQFWIWISILSLPFLSPPNSQFPPQILL